MIVYSLLLITIFLGLTSLSLVACGKAYWPRFTSGIGLGVFIYLYGAWIYSSYYAKWLFGAALLLTLIVTIAKPARSRLHAGKGRMIMHFGIAIVAAVFSVLFFTGTAGAPRSVNMQFPLKHGQYFVLQGGKGMPANLFHSTGRGAVYAMDLVRLDNKGKRCRHIFSKNLTDYFIFGDTIFSPCTGVVQRAVSDNPDNIPPNRERGPHNLNGVVIEGADYFVFLGHMQQDKVFVTAGQRVAAGAPLGLAGNSGFSLEPHVHIQAHAKDRPGLPWYHQQQLFIRFDNHAYLLFERINTATLSANTVPE